MTIPIVIIIIVIVIIATIVIVATMEIKIQKMIVAMNKVIKKNIRYTRC